MAFPTVTTILPTINTILPTVKLAAIIVKPKLKSPPVRGRGCQKEVYSDISHLLRHYADLCEKSTPEVCQTKIMRQMGRALSNHNKIAAESTLNALIPLIRKNPGENFLSGYQINWKANYFLKMIAGHLDNSFLSKAVDTTAVIKACFDIVFSIVKKALKIFDPKARLLIVRENMVRLFVTTIHQTTMYLDNNSKLALQQKRNYWFSILQGYKDSGDDDVKLMLNFIDNFAVTFPNRLSSSPTAAPSGAVTNDRNNNTSTRNKCVIVFCPYPSAEMRNFYKSSMQL
jgi:hypothetical protein